MHQLVSFDDEMDVLVNSAHGSIAECDDYDDDDDDDAVRNAWSLLDDSDESSKKQRRHPRRRRCDDAPPPIVARESKAKLVVPSSIGRRANIEERYLVDPRILGTGHQGSVRECVDRSTGESYAVKSMRKRDPAVDPRRISREVELLREMRHHKNIVRLVDVFEDDEYFHIVTNLCRGGELFDGIVRKSSDVESDVPCFAEDDAARIMYQILSAVSHMHGRGVAHRDIKPENVLFDSPEEGSPVRIADFGLSRRLGVTIGVIAYVLLCGYPPFSGATDSETRELVLRGRYVFHAEEWGNISGEAMDFVRGLLRVDPRRRTTVQRALSHPWIVRHVYSAMNDMLD